MPESLKRKGFVRKLIALLFTRLNITAGYPLWMSILSANDEKVMQKVKYTHPHGLFQQFFYFHFKFLD